VNLSTEAPRSRRTLRLAALIALATAVAYFNSFAGVFVFDDATSIPDNPTIRQLWPPGPLLHPPIDAGRTVGGRPLLNISLALNYAAGGTSVWGYHATNLAIHLLAALTLFAIVRRTLKRTERAEIVAFFAAMLWAVHPLQTEAVTYIVQRAESLMGLFYLLTLYAFIRAAEDQSKTWAALSVGFCLLGMATKEVMVSAPVIVFFYDAIFVAGGFRAAWRRRRGYYASLAATWLLLGYLVLAAHGRGGSAGFGNGAAWSTYLLTQPSAVWQYLALAVWPNPLVFDYGTRWATSLLSVAPAFVAVIALVVAIVWALRRRPAFGFLGTWFCAILAPTSLIPGGRMTMADHRMYLALAPIAVLAALGLVALPRRIAWCALTGIAGVFVTLTLDRNRDYHSELQLWTDTIAKRPDNVFARENLGGILFHLGRPREAIAQYEAALQLKPDYAEAQNNWGMVLASLGQTAEAIAHYKEAVRLKRDYAEPYNHWGIALSAAGKGTEAMAKLQEALRLKPDYPEAENNLGLAYASQGRWPEAITHYTAALRLGAEVPETENNLGLALAYSGRVPEALGHFQRSVQLDPDNALARNALGTALRSTGRSPAAVLQYEAALKLRPDFPEAAFNLANALTDVGAIDRAIANYQLALQLRPDYAEASLNLGLALAGAGRTDEAMAAYRSALRSRPGYAAAHRNLASLLIALGRTAEAAAELKAVEPGR
jgi:tetratricopeptide (TPR) repeat protein